MSAGLDTVGRIIALDLMGGDKAPKVNIEGCRAALDSGAKILAFGTEDAVRELHSRVSSSNLATVVCPDVIHPSEAPLHAYRQKPYSSLCQGLLAVSEGRAQAFVSAGSTGAMVVAAVLSLGRAPGVDKPCMGAVIPTSEGRGTFFVDLGASSDVRPQTLVQFAVMGTIYARDVLGWPDPKVCLLNIGLEKEKGNALARKAYALLEKAPISFSGNIEPRDVFTQKADVVVTDGFTGNVFLKTLEGTGVFQLSVLNREIVRAGLEDNATQSLERVIGKVGALLDYTTYGGAPLMGLNGCVIKCHGSSDGRAIANGIREARIYLEKNVTSTFTKMLSDVVQKGE